jgi:hypothetical protein
MLCPNLIILFHFLFPDSGEKRTPRRSNTGDGFTNYSSNPTLPNDIKTAQKKAARPCTFLHGANHLPVLSLTDHAPRFIKITRPIIIGAAYSL